MLPVLSLLAKLPLWIAEHADIVARTFLFFHEMLNEGCTQQENDQGQFCAVEHWDPSWGPDIEELRRLGSKFGGYVYVSGGMPHYNNVDNRMTDFLIEFRRRALESTTAGTSCLSRFSPTAVQQSFRT